MLQEHTHRAPTPPAAIDLKDLAAKSRIPLSTLRRYWNGIAPTYFIALRIQYHTRGQVTPEHFRRFLKPTDYRPRRASLHGEAVWGTPLGQRLAFIIIESEDHSAPAKSTAATAWFKKHGLKPGTIYSMLINGHVPRRDAVEQLSRATNRQITIREIYDPTWRIPHHRGKKRPRAAA